MSANSILSPYLDDGELIPQDGKDETYDTISEEIQSLEESLEEELKEYEKQLKYVVFSDPWSMHSMTLYADVNLSGGIASTEPRCV